MPYNPGVQDISGQIWGQGIQNAAKGFTKGLQEYYRKKEEKDREDQFLEFIKPKAAELGLQLTGDPAQDDKMLRAGVKAMGPHGMMQFGQFLTARDQQKQQMAAHAEMQNAQIAHLNAQTDQAKALMKEHAAEGEAVRYASSPAEMMAPATADGSGPPPGWEPDRVLEYYQSGGRNPQTAAALMKERPWSPSAVSIDEEGGRMLMTSPRSAVPDPAMRATSKRPKNDAPEYSPDKKFYRSGPEDDWKPVPREPGEELPKLQDLLVIQTLQSDPKMMQLWEDLKKKVPKSAATGAEDGAATAAGKNLPRPKSKQERDKLADGAQYYGPDGQVYTKQPAKK